MTLRNESRAYDLGEAWADGRPSRRRPRPAHRGGRSLPKWLDQSETVLRHEMACSERARRDDCPWCLHYPECLSVAAHVTRGPDGRSYVYGADHVCSADCDRYERRTVVPPGVRSSGGQCVDEGGEEDE